MSLGSYNKPEIIFIFLVNSLNIFDNIWVRKASSINTMCSLNHSTALAQNLVKDYYGETT